MISNGMKTGVPAAGSMIFTRDWLEKDREQKSVKILFANVPKNRVGQTTSSNTSHLAYGLAAARCCLPLTGRQLRPN
jgi:hypothetical protein